MLLLLRCHDADIERTYADYAMLIDMFGVTDVMRVKSVTVLAYAATLLLCYVDITGVGCYAIDTRDVVDFASDSRALSVMRATTRRCLTCARCAYDKRALLRDVGCAILILCRHAFHAARR